jgi:hypothetical protein
LFLDIPEDSTSTFSIFNWHFSRAKSNDFVWGYFWPQYGIVFNVKWFDGKLYWFVDCPLCLPFECRGSPFTAGQMRHISLLSFLLGIYSGFTLATFKATSLQSHARTSQCLDRCFCISLSQNDTANWWRTGKSVRCHAATGCCMQCDCNVVSLERDHCVHPGNKPT